MEKEETFRIGSQHMLKTCEVGTNPALEVSYTVNGVDKVRYFKVFTISQGGVFVEPKKLSELLAIEEMNKYMVNVLIMLDREIPVIKEVIYHGRLLTENGVAPDAYIWRHSSAT